jgi:EpsD family peptidyl-prolyl cis-trans isomerase
MPTRARPFLFAGCLLPLAFLLCACSEAGAEKEMGRAAARVDGKEISMRQLNAVLLHAQDASGTTEQQRNEILSRLINQQVLYAEAVNRRLDRDPRVQVLLEAAKRETLARAYMDALLAQQSDIPAADKHQYYVENPYLFAQRKIYTLQDFSLTAVPRLQEPLARMIKDERSMEDIGKFLAARGVEFSSASGVRTAEQIPLDVLPRLAGIADGKTTLIESGRRYYIFHVVSSQSVPLSEKEALPRIEVFLKNQQAQRIVAQEVQRLKANARIEYLGDFSKAAVTDSVGAVAVLNKQERTAR